MCLGAKWDAMNPADNDDLDAGDADGLGETRKKELVKSGVALGLRKEDDVFVVESPYVPSQLTPPPHLQLLDRPRLITTPSANSQIP